MPTCPDCHAYGSMAELNTHMCIKPSPVVIPYETTAMLSMRRILLSRGVTDAQISSFKTCLLILENQGYRIISPN